MLVIPCLVNCATASPKVGGAQSRNAVSTLRPVRRASSDVTACTASFAEATVEPCAKRISPVMAGSNSIAVLVVAEEVPAGRIRGGSQ